jgi:hypothetical protein
MSLFDRYVAERKPAPATQKAFKRQIKKLIDFLGHEDARRVTPASPQRTSSLGRTSS